MRGNATVPAAPDLEFLSIKGALRGHKGAYEAALRELEILENSKKLRPGPPPVSQKSQALRKMLPAANLDLEDKEACTTAELETRVLETLSYLQMERRQSGINRTSEKRIDLSFGILRILAESRMIQNSLIRQVLFILSQELRNAIFSETDIPYFARLRDAVEIATSNSNEVSKCIEKLEFANSQILYLENLKEETALSHDAELEKYRNSVALSEHQSLTIKSLRGKLDDALEQVRELSAALAQSQNRIQFFIESESDKDVFKIIAESTKEINNILQRANDGDDKLDESVSDTTAVSGSLISSPLHSKRSLGVEVGFGDLQRIEHPIADRKVSGISPLDSDYHKFSVQTLESSPSMGSPMEHPREFSRDLTDRSLEGSPKMDEVNYTSSSVNNQGLNNLAKRILNIHPKDTKRVPTRHHSVLTMSRKRGFQFADGHAPYE